MQIITDIDEVLAPFMSNFLDFYNKRNGTSFSTDGFHTYNIWEVAGVDESVTTRAVREFYESDIFRNMPPITNSREALTQISIDGRIFALTARPEYLREETERWLGENYGCLIEHVFFTNQYGEGNSTTKGRICRELKAKVLIDDSQAYLLDCLKNNSNMEGILFNCPWNATAEKHPKIRRVHRWTQIPRLIGR